MTVVDAAASPGVGPRRVWSDSKGVIWVSFWQAGAIGRYDPATKAWTSYPMPQSKSGTYSVYVDDKDRVWATDWAANAIQRFDPKTETYATLPERQEEAPTCARCSDGRARRGAGNPERIGWWSCATELRGGITPLRWCL